MLELAIHAPQLDKLAPLALMAQDHYDDQSSDACEQALAHVFEQETRFERGEHLCHEGTSARATFVLREGWAARTMNLAAGRRQIVELLLPGDLFPVYHSEGAPCEGIVALGACRAASCPPRALEAAALEHPELARLLWQLTARSKRIFRMWIANLGQRDCYARIAHMICELRERLAQTGKVTDGSFDVPLTQEDLADVCGVTSVHVNRTLQQLRRDGLFELRHRRACMLDAEGLKMAADFDSAYLQTF